MAPEQTAGTRQCLNHPPSAISAMILLEAGLFDANSKNTCEDLITNGKS